MHRKRRVIINADDFGLSAGVNAGIIEAHERGVVTSTSLMVRWPAALDAAQYAKARQQLDVGLHLDFGEWVWRGGEWAPLYEVVSAPDAPAIEKEVARQLDAFRRLVGREPTHIDSHQHVHCFEPARSIVGAMAAELDVPLRRCTGRIAYCGGFYGQNERGQSFPELISPVAVAGLLERLPPGVTELSCHPARGQDVGGMYVRERELELRTLCDPRLSRALEDLNIELCSFSDLFREKQPQTQMAS